MSHKFSVNQAVVFTPGAGEIISLATMATVTRLLPVEGANISTRSRWRLMAFCGGFGKISFGLGD
jgi:hypothetical protein